MKKNLPMRVKLISLCAFFVVIILGTNIYEGRIMKEIVASLDEISNVQFPAMRYMGLIDMYHDGLRGVVYNSLYTAEKNDVKGGEEVKKDMETTAKEMNELIASIRKLPLAKETKLAIEDSIPAVEAFIKKASEIVDLAVKGDRAGALSHIEEFNVEFSKLEEKLGALGELIEKSAQSEQARSEEVSSGAKTTNNIIIILSLVVGGAATWFIVNKLLNSISEAIENLSKSAHDVQNSSQKVNLIARRINSSVESQVSSITESVTAMDEISAMIKNNNNSAQNASNLSALTKSSADSGKQTVDKMMNEMKEISSSYDSIQSSVNKNSEDIKKIIDVIAQISTKTQVINDIVFQTKLLSFNASVEAARAGEHGKGFAVVAEEVGKLAQMSGNASTEIAEMLDESISQVRQIAESMTSSIVKIVDGGRDKVISGNEVAKDCLQELEKILSCVTDLDHSINEISVAIKEQSIGVEEVNTALKTLDSAAHEASEMASRSSDASEELRVQSHNLRTTIQTLRKVLGAEKSYDVPPVDEFGKANENTAI